MLYGAGVTEFVDGKKASPTIQLIDWHNLEKNYFHFTEEMTLQNEYVMPKTSWVMGLPRFRIMAMEKQWGSCSTKGYFMLSLHLIKAPKECIDYMILHDLCHIDEHNHSDRFWRLLTQVMPYRKEVKAKLDDVAELYLNG